MIPVVFGYAEPDSQLWAMAERGEVHLGGCSIRVGVPPWWCPACGHEVPDEDE
jgi:YgiT-type zinc finger domain-containing protein